MLDKIISKNLPDQWNIFRHESTHDKDYFQFNIFDYYMTKHPSLNLEALNVFGEDIHSYEYFKFNSESIRSWFNGLIIAHHKSIPAVQLAFGLDRESIDNTLNDFISYLDKKGTLELLEGNRYDDGGLGFQCYAPQISFLNKYISGNEKIVEIGCGTDGLGALSYLQHKGFEVFGLDALDINQSILNKIDVKTIKSYWENIDKHFDLESVDVFYTNFMHPSPFLHLYNYSDDSYFSNHRNYNDLISNVMNKVLKPNGLFIQRTSGSDYINEYIINPSEKLFDTVTIPIDSSNELDNMIFSDAISTKYFKKTTIPINSNMKINYGKTLLISQKK